LKAVEVKKGIYWVGGIDWGVRNFHGYLTEKGSTYNAYLVIDEKITLIDTVKGYLADEMIQRISSVIDPAKIDYVVCNHVEMDHSGAMPKIMDIAKNAIVITCPNGDKGLKAHYKKDWNCKIVKSGDSISLGERSLNFVLTPMVHWPDNMVAYMPEDKILFSNDAFGQHLASSERFDDEYPLDLIMEQAAKYYANIVMPYGMQVNKALQESKPLNIEMIAPSHGIIWRTHAAKIIKQYSDWVANTPEKKSVIIYDTMWKSTETIAYTLLDTFEEKGYKTVLMNLQDNHISDVITEVLSSEYVCVGSPTLNNNIMPNVAAFLTYLKGLSPKKRKAIAFGSYGWSGQSIGQVEEYLKECSFEVIDTVRLQYVPDIKDLDEAKLRIMEKI
jgi:flavorubredoxin